MSTSSYELVEVHELQQTIEHIEKCAISGDQPSAEERIRELFDFTFDLKDCSWEDVLTELERAQNATEEHNKRGNSWYHKHWRSFGSTAGVFGAGLSAFPDELSPLHGGLAVIFSIARHRTQDRLKILSAFEEIPSIMHMAYNKSKVFPRDASNMQSIHLHNCVDALTKTLLKVLPELIQLLNPGRIFSRLTSGLQRDKIDTLLDHVTRSAQQVRSAAEVMTDITLTTTHQTVLSNHRMTKDIHIQLAEVKQLQVSLQDTFDALSGKNGLLNFIMESLNSPAPQRPPSPGQTPHQLLTALSVQLTSPIHAESHVLRRGVSLPDETTGPAAYMLRTPPVQQLMHTSGSGIVLVNAHGDRSGSISPISYVVATLAQGLRRQGIPVLVFFCGLHTGDDLRGPGGLLRCLVAQLVMVLLERGWIDEGTNVGGADDLGVLFGRLVGFVPEGKGLWCLLDGVGYLEGEQCAGEWEGVVESLDRAVRRRDGGWLKVLMTCSGVSRGLGVEHQRVDLRGGRVG